MDFIKIVGYRILNTKLTKPRSYGLFTWRCIQLCFLWIVSLHVCIFGHHCSMERTLTSGGLGSISDCWSSPVKPWGRHFIKGGITYLGHRSLTQGYQLKRGQYVFATEGSSDLRLLSCRYCTALLLSLRTSWGKEGSYYLKTERKGRKGPSCSW